MFFVEIESRKVSDSIVETVHMVRPQHLNASDRLFGGALMQWIDEVAGMVAKRHTRRNVITASVDSLSFLRGAYVKDTVVIIGKVTYVGNTSMEVKVDTYVEALSGERTPINHAYFTMVALDKNDKPVRAPRLELETEEEKEEVKKFVFKRGEYIMKKILLSIILTAIITACITANYIITHQQVSGTTGNYNIEILDHNFSYR